MTDVEFHFNVPDRQAYACRLLRKAVRKGAGVAVTAPPATLDELDRLLWTFEDTGFLPHLRLAANAAPAPLQQRTPIWLVDRAEQAAHLPVLVYLGEQPAEGFGSFERLIEIVSTDPSERESARLRWRHYASRGYAIKRHEVTA
ncbi:DNA polymerase III subunit chi [Piscinibacter sakaiensis]|uniref:DNA polymerase III subunit chi n=1 Tax=Piscinibacter sakaiensis TaxID=1547922 RepID=UPI003AB0C984